MLNLSRFQVNTKQELMEAIANYELWGIDFYYVNDCLEDLSYIDCDISLISNDNNILIVVLPKEYCTVTIQYDDDDYIRAIGYTYGF